MKPYEEAGYDYGYAEFYKEIGYIITGSKTFEQASHFPGGWAFPHAVTYIFTSRELDVQGRRDLIIWRGGIDKLVNDLRSKGKDTWLIGGASLAGQFFNRNMVDEMVLSIMPTVLGKGLPLFDDIEKQIDFVLKKREVFPNGVVQLTYAPK